MKIGEFVKYLDVIWQIINAEPNWQGPILLTLRAMNKIKNTTLAHETYCTQVHENDAVMYSLSN